MRLEAVSLQEVDLEMGRVLMASILARVVLVAVQAPVHPVVVVVFVH
jgi:hypothetical protein